MNVTFACPSCENTTRDEFDAMSTGVTCMHCGHEAILPADGVVDDRVERCLVCPSRELYVRKNFPQRLGVTIVVLGLAASCVPWYFQNWYATFAILFATALIDVMLYLVTGNLLQCYRCHAQYRGVAGLEEHGAFDLEVHERHRQQVARLKQSQASQGEQPTS